MGMYTELYLGCEIMTGTPDNVIDVLKHLALGEQMPESLPDHEFFQCDRWMSIMNCSSFYFIPFATAKMEYESISKSYHITTRSDLKNYEGEIEKFIDWLTPYIDAEPGDHLGHKRYEESSAPTLLYHPNKWVLAPEPENEVYGGYGYGR